MAGYTNAEYADMHLMYGQAEGNNYEARRLYEANFPDRRIPDRRTFQAVDRRLRETGRLQVVHVEGRPRNRNDNIEERVLEMVDENSATSTRRIGIALGVNNVAVWRILREYLLHPFRLQKVQALKPTDYPQRERFCEWFLRRNARNVTFPATILFTDVAQFSRDGIMNSHNQHYWADENPHAMFVRAHQEKFSINVWCGIVGDNLIGPYTLPARLTGQNYTQFLEETLPGLLEDVPLQTRRQMWFMHDGAPPHFSLLARAHLDTVYPFKWIGRGEPVPWPPRSPDLNPLDFFLWGAFKTLVYATEVPDIQELQRRVEHSCEAIRNTAGIFGRVRGSLIERAQVCQRIRGRHFEQLS